MAILLLLGAVACSNGQNISNFQEPQIRAALAQDPPPQSDRVVFFDNISLVGDTIGLDVVVRDGSGTLTIDDADLVLRYDSTFLQVASVLGQSTLFGTCNTVNPVCGVNSPICTDNHAVANGGGERFCRGNGSTLCATDADCTAPGDACGSFGILEAAFAVLTGPKFCSNNTVVGCSTSADCRLCAADLSQVCTIDDDCTGTCQVGGTCTRPAGRPCATAIDCADTCDLGTCLGCPEVTIGGTQRLATLTLRVMREGTGDLRLVVSTNPLDRASFLRRNTVEQAGVVFHPSVDATDPAIRSGAIVITDSR